MSQPHEGSAKESHTAVEALKEMGPLPVQFLEWMNDGFDALHKVGMPRPLKLKSLAILLCCAALLAACGEMPDPSTYRDFASEMHWEATVDAAVATQKAAGEYPYDQQVVIQTPTETPRPPSDGLRPYQPEATYHWRYSTTVQSGEGVWAAFVRKAAEDGYRFSWFLGETGEFTEAVEIWRNNQMIELHSLQNVLDRSPMVHPGDVLVHTFVTSESIENMKRFNGLLAENIHLP